MTTIYLVRHGQKQSFAGDPGLTEVGIQQAQEAGQFLKQFPITQIISSPFKRAEETATEIAKILDLQHSLDQRLVERMNWDGQVSKEDFFAEWVKATADRKYSPRFGSSSFDAGQKIQELVEHTKVEDAHLVLVTHGGVIIDYLRSLFGDEKVAHLRRQYPAGDDFEMRNAAINKVILAEEPILELVNYVDHLTTISE